MSYLMTLSTVHVIQHLFRLKDDYEWRNQSMSNKIVVACFTTHSGHKLEKLRKITRNLSQDSLPLDQNLTQDIPDTKYEC
jgi:hypothetical protein